MQYSYKHRTSVTDFRSYWDSKSTDERNNVEAVFVDPGQINPGDTVNIYIRPKSLGGNCLEPFGDQRVHLQDFALVVSNFRAKGTESIKQAVLGVIPGSIPDHDANTDTRVDTADVEKSRKTQAAKRRSGQLNLPTPSPTPLQPPSLLSSPETGYQ
jgi:hypothetical protein